MPLQTMSYWNALMVSGSCVFSASSPPCGMLNGLWLKSTCPVSSFSSNIGKSVIQQNRNAPFSDQAEFLAEPGAHRAGEFRRHVLLAGGEEHRVAGVQAAARHGSPRRAPVPGCARSAPSGRRRRKRCSPARPAPSAFAQSFSLSKKLRGCEPRPAPGSRARSRRTPRSARTARTRSRHTAASRRRSAADCAGPACRCRIPASPCRRGCAGRAAGVTARPSANSSNTPAITGSIVANTSSCVT